MSELADLGLSSYEDAAYRALLECGRATASEVAAASDVPEGRIYDVLNGLAARDLVRTLTGGEPRRYEAVPPASAVDRLLTERERELDAERERYRELADAVRTDLASTVPVEGRFWPVDVGDADALAGMGEQFSRAEDRVWSVVGPPYGEADPAALRRETEAYLDLVGRGVEARLLLSTAVLAALSEETVAGATDAEGLAVRTAPSIGLTFDVVDGEAVYLHVPAPFAPGERVGTVGVPDADLASGMAAAFRDAWADARPVDSPAE